MIPEFRLRTKDKDITDQIAQKLDLLSVIDESGIHADRLEISLDNGRRPYIERPKLGLELELALGYRGELVEVGTYYVDEVEVSGPVRMMSVKASAVDFSGEIAAPLEKSWHSTTFGKITEEIAGRHKLKPTIPAKLANLEVAHEDQTESDIQFLIRLGLELGAVVTAKGKRLVVTPIAPEKAIDGGELPEIVVRPGDVENWTAIVANRGDYTGVRAFWQSRRGAKKHRIEVGDSSKTMTLPYPYRTEALALAAADTRLRALSRGTGTLNFSGAGNLAFAAEHRIKLEGFEDGSDGIWVTSRVEHSFSDSGLKTSVEAESVADR